MSYKTKADTLPGSNYKEVNKNALAIFKTIRKRTKRKPYVQIKKKTAYVYVS